MNTPSQKRILSPYEKNELRKYQIPEKTLLQTQAPVEYITNHVSFCSLDFYVTDAVLIPRIETEELVAMAIAQAKKMYAEKQKPLIIADIGTGSGAIAIALAKQLHELQIPYELFATEVSMQALKIAKKNHQNLSKDLNLTFLTSNLLEAFLTNTEYPKKIDLIVSNLPYIPSGRLPHLDPSVINYEPRLALDGGESGLDLIHKLIKQARQLCTTGSSILLEADYTHDYSDFSEHKENWDITINKDTSGVTFIILTRKQ